MIGEENKVFFYPYPSARSYNNPKKFLLNTKL